MNAFFIAIALFLLINFYSRTRMMNAMKLLSPEKKDQLFSLVTNRQKLQFFGLLFILAMMFLFAYQKVIDQQTAFLLLGGIFLIYIFLQQRQRIKLYREHDFPTDYIKEITTAGYIQLGGFLLFWVVLILFS